MPTVDELKADAKTNLDDVKNSCLTPMTNKTFCGIGFSSTLLKKYEDEYSLLKKKKEEADKDSTGKETKTNLYKDVIKASESLKKTLDGEINKALYNEIKDTYPKCKTCMADINTDNAKTRLMEQVRTQFSSDIKEYNKKIQKLEPSTLRTEMSTFLGELQEMYKKIRFLET